MEQKNTKRKERHLLLTIDSSERMPRSYSTQFKKKVLDEWRAGATTYALNLKYGIGGADTINRWARNEGFKAESTKKIFVCTPEEKAELERLRDENGKLKGLIGKIVYSLELLEQLTEEVRRRNQRVMA